MATFFNTGRRRSSIALDREVSWHAQIAHNPTIESMPAPILSRVMAKLSTKDIKNVCLVSKRMHQVASAAIVRSVTVVLNPTYREVHSSAAQTTVIYTPLNYLLFVVTQLQSGSHLGDIEELRFVSTKGFNTYQQNAHFKRFWSSKVGAIASEFPLDAIAQMPVFQNMDLPQLTMQDTLAFLVRFLPKLHSLDAPYADLSQLCRVPQLTRLTVTSADSVKTIPSQFESTHIESLHIVYEDSSYSCIVALANALAKSDTSRLRHLTLEAVRTDFNESDELTWLVFFNALYESKTVLSLHTLILKNCVVGDKQDLVSKILRQSVDLAGLATLDLGISELTHKGLSHDVSVLKEHGLTDNFLLVKLAPHLRDLTSLSIRPTKNCLTCQIRGVVTFLKLYRDRLQHLNLEYSSLNENDILEVNNTLIEYQTQLRHLKYRDQSYHFNIRNSMNDWFLENEVDLKMNPVHTNESLHQQCFPSASSSYITKEFTEMVTKNSTMFCVFFSRFFNDGKVGQNLYFDMIVTRLPQLDTITLFGFILRVNHSKKTLSIQLDNAKSQLLMFYN